jgi:hypothetical protein
MRLLDSFLSYALKGKRGGRRFRGRKEKKEKGYKKEIK